MSHILFEKEVNQLKKMGVPHYLAIMTACASRMTDETYTAMFHATLNKTKEENNMVGAELRKAGMRPVEGTSGSLPNPPPEE